MIGDPCDQWKAVGVVFRGRVFQAPLASSTGRPSSTVTESDPSPGYCRMRAWPSNAGRED